MAQSGLAGLIVVLCFGYTAWALMPARWRAALQRRLTGRNARPSSGCGACGGCSGAPGPATADRPVQVVRLHRRLGSEPR